MTLTLSGARLVDVTGVRPDSSLAIAGGRIRAVGPGAIAQGKVLDLSGLTVLPGFIDVHTHGGGGFSLHTESADEIRRYAGWAPSTGVTGFLAGVVGVPGGPPERQLAAVADAIETAGPGAEVIGIHLEGPYINVRRRGAHDPSWLRLPSQEESERVLRVSRGHLKLATVAPELPGAREMIRTLLDAAVTVSIGHTEASYAEARAAIALGVSHATHCFNAMPPLHHRSPGPLGAIVESTSVMGELIGDCVHVHPSIMRLLIRGMGPERTIIVTDALAGAGVDDAVFTFGGQEATVSGGAARLADGTLTGSVLTMDQALRNLLGPVGIPLVDAVGMLTWNPARSAGVAGRKGKLASGFDADLAIFDASWTLHATFCCGELAYASGEWRRRFGA